MLLYRCDHRDLALALISEEVHADWSADYDASGSSMMWKRSCIFSCGNGS